MVEGPVVPARPREGIVLGRTRWGWKGKKNRPRVTRAGKQKETVTEMPVSGTGCFHGTPPVRGSRSYVDVASPAGAKLIRSGVHWFDGWPLLAIQEGDKEATIRRAAEQIPGSGAVTREVRITQPWLDL